MFVLAGMIGFMGPFGTWLQSNLANRVSRWWWLLMGAYVIVRPAIALLRRLARSTGLARRTVEFWGVAFCSLPLAVAWRAIGQDAFRALDDYTGLLPFSFVCALSVLGIVQWAEYTDRRMAMPVPPAKPHAPDPEAPEESSRSGPALMRRLPPTFHGPILAIQSEDHYVRVHGPDGSELVLLRLRDAIAEMEGIRGEQIHRSWWVASDAAREVVPTERSWLVRLPNGREAPVARDSVSRLQRSGFLPQ